MAEKAPLKPSADVAAYSGDQRLKSKFDSSHEYDDTQAVRERGRKRLKWLGAGLVILAVVGAAVGLGVGFGTQDKKEDKPTKQAAATPATTSSSNITVDQLQFLPNSRAQAKALLQNTTSDEAKSALQALEDSDSLTPQAVIDFLDYFDKKANLTSKGVDVAFFKSQAYSFVRWLRARPGLSDVLDALRKFVKNPNMNPVQLAQAIEQVAGNLKVADFQQFLSWKSDKDDRLNSTALDGMIELSEEEELGGLDDPATGAKGRRSLLQGASTYLDPINQAVFKAIPNSYINNPRNAGLKDFKPVTVPIIFHALQYFDPRGYTFPYNAYGQGSKPGRDLVNQMNRAYAAANVKFVLREFRNNPKVHKYLKIGRLEAWQSCATEAEICTCSLAKLYNVNPSKVLNIWVVGSDSLQFANLPDVAYATVIPRVMDSCKDVMQWGTPSSRSQHVWLSWDMVDPDGQNSGYAYQFGAMTLIHEVGHFLGLLHTHEGDCQDLDRVRDTPANLVIQDQGFNTDLQKWCISNYGKSLGQATKLKRILSKFDSCRNKPYIDNFGNFMSYVHSACYRLFTVGQIRRMQKTIQVYHKNFK